MSEPWTNGRLLYGDQSVVWLRSLQCELSALLQSVIQGGGTFTLLFLSSVEVDDCMCCSRSKM